MFLGLILILQEITREKLIKALLLCPQTELGKLLIFVIYPLPFDEQGQVIQDLIILNNNTRDRNKNNSTELQIIKERIDLVICALLNLNDAVNTNITELLTQFKLYSSMITREIRGVHSRPAVIVFERCKVLSGNKGRSKTYLAEDTLIYLHEIGYKWKNILISVMIA